MSSAERQHPGNNLPQRIIAILQDAITALDDDLLCKVRNTTVNRMVDCGILLQKWPHSQRAGDMTTLEPIIEKLSELLAYLYVKNDHLCDLLTECSDQMRKHYTDLLQALKIQVPPSTEHIPFDVWSVEKRER